MGTEDRNRKYIYSQLAQIRPLLEETLQLSVRTNALSRMDKAELARYLWQAYSSRVWNRLLEYQNTHLMKIAECGLGGATPANGTRLMDLDMEFRRGYNGRCLVADVAAGAIIAALTDQVWDELQKAKVKAQKPKAATKRIKCHFCNFTTAKFGRQGGTPVSGFDVMWSHLSDAHRDKAAEIEKYLGEDVTEEV